MVLVALFAALVCLILGLIFAYGPWLVASLVASGLAAIILWRQREQRSSGSGRRRAQSPTSSRDDSAAGSAPQRSLATGSAVAARAGGRRPRPTPASADREVWVVDGRPDYHAKNCAQITTDDAEPVPLTQARADGFAECLDCTPVPNSDAEVWVIDGRPDYHRDDCTRLRRGAAEQVRLGQALDDGFAACEQCRPPGAAPQPDEDGAADDSDTADPQPAVARDATDRVWVVDGRPRYHLESCLIIQDQDAEPVPLEQATEDGFMPCSMCEPFVSKV